MTAAEVREVLGRSMPQRLRDALAAGLAAMEREEARGAGALSVDQILVACRNVGIDLSCDACAETFYTGSTVHPHAHSDASSRRIAERLESAEVRKALIEYMGSSFGDGDDEDVDSILAIIRGDGEREPKPTAPPDQRDRPATVRELEAVAEILTGAIEATGHFTPSGLDGAALQKRVRKVLGVKRYTIPPEPKP